MSDDVHDELANLSIAAKRQWMGFLRNRLCVIRALSSKIDANTKLPAEVRHDARTMDRACISFLEGCEELLFHKERQDLNAHVRKTEQATCVRIGRDDHLAHYEDRNGKGE